MNSRDKLIHKALASSMNYQELTSMVGDLICEKRELQPYFQKSELKKYDDLIDIYEMERKLVIYLLTMRNHSKSIH